jgi:hypothetical protein
MGVGTGPEGSWQAAIREDLGFLGKFGWGTKRPDFLRNPAFRFVFERFGGYLLSRKLYKHYHRQCGV